jgi:hypothetical protein
MLNLPSGFDNIRVWDGSREAYANPPEFIALFNLGDKASTLHFDWNELAKQKSHKTARDLFTGSSVNVKVPMTLTLPPHGSTAFRLE